MKMLCIAVSLATAFIVSPGMCCAQPRKAIQTIVKVLIGVGAAESARRSGLSYEEFKHEDAILTQLRNQGVDASSVSIYSVYFKTTGGYWADLWSKPDLFFIVDIEGQGSKLIPQIHYNYRGEPILDIVVSESIQPGARIVVRVIDDDSSSDMIWNGILKTRANLSVTAEVSATQFVSVHTNASGQIALLDQNVTLDAPDFVASAEFTVPEADDGIWVADAKLIDASEQDVGSLQFASVWSASQQLAEQQGKVGKSFSSFLFWGVLSICLLGWFARNLITSSGKTTEEPDST